MELSGIPQNAASNNEMINAARAGDMAPMKKSDILAEPVKIPAVEQADLKRLDEQRLSDIKRVIERNSFKDVFAVRDNSFTIFKDKSGQYVTRFTDLRDGTVTYVPEPEILKYNGADTSYVQVQA